MEEVPMDQETMRRLRFDKRLQRRRGGVSKQELAEYLDSLPDASDKILPPEEREEPAREGGDSRPSEA
jgi:hypothetical protein